MKPERPDPATFEPGDIIWPKKPGVFVPYHSKPTGNYEKDKAQWEREIQIFLNRARQRRLTSEAAATVAMLASISFDEFLAFYLGDLPAGLPSIRGKDGPIYVGHTGIIYFEDSSALVVEAVPPKVRQIPYRDWLAEREGANVWHGRLTRLSLSDRERIIVEAKKHVGKPYDFWNFNLNDDTGFYCSKLAWLAVFRGVRVALDDNRDPDRPIWYSPKQLMRSPHLDLLFKPGPYIVR